MFCLFFATFLALIANLLGHYLFGGIRLSGRTGALSRSARIQLISLIGTLMLLKALAYWLDRYELLSHTRAVSHSPAPATPTSTPCYPPNSSCWPSR